MADYRLIAQYPKAQVVRDRNLGGLIEYAAYTRALPIPTVKPDPAWVKQRIVAGQIALQAAVYVDRTMYFFMMDPATEASLRDLLSEWNDEAGEVALSAQIQNVVGSFMPTFSDLEVSDSQVQQWYIDNGFPAAV
jgi:hypothetical protein